MEIDSIGAGHPMTERSSTDHVSTVGPEERVSEVVLRSISAVSNRPLRELPPLQESVEMDALDQLFASSTSVELLRFEYEEFEVSVEPTRVTVRDRR